MTRSDFCRKFLTRSIIMSRELFARGRATISSRRCDSESQEHWLDSSNRIFVSCFLYFVWLYAGHYWKSAVLCWVVFLVKYINEYEYEFSADSCLPNKELCITWWHLQRCAKLYKIDSWITWILLVIRFDPWSHRRDLESWRGPPLFVAFVGFLELLSF